MGIEPEVRRIGTFKSAGDQLLRKDMSDSQREQLTAILEDVTLGFKQTIADARCKTVEEVRPSWRNCTMAVLLIGWPDDSSMHGQFEFMPAH